MRTDPRPFESPFESLDPGPLSSPSANIHIINIIKWRLLGTYYEEYPKTNVVDPDPHPDP